jgi:phosphoglycolate phosphatase-like HAD superfamily hydrolase
MTVLLFDIDGTLIKTGGAGGVALLEAFSDLFGVPDPAEVPFSGRTDRGIAQSLFRLHDIEDTDENFQQLRSGYLKRLGQCLAECEGEVLPGVIELLEQLAQQPAVALGLLTGNTREGAQMKLEHYGLWHHFSFGGFGDAHVDRNHVAHEALAAYREWIGDTVDGRPVWVIGDTPLDIQCARAIGAKVVAVATGWHDRQRLEVAQPDLLLDDLKHTEMIVQHTLADVA